MKPIYLLLLALLSFWGAFSQGEVHVAAGTFLKSADGASVVLENTSLKNNGTIDYSGTGAVYRFSGGVHASLSGTGTTTLNKLLIHKPGGQLFLQQPVTVTTEVAFSAGLLNLGNSIVDLQQTGMLTGETETSRAYTAGSGYLQATGNLLAPNGVNLGNLGVYIFSSQPLGLVTLRRGHQVQGGGNSIQRYYDILPANNTGLSAALTFTYFDAELNGLEEAALTMWKSENGGAWTNINADGRNTTLNSLDKSGIPSLGRFTLATPGNPLPLSFLLFNGKCTGNVIRLIWKTAHEINVKQFHIERSFNSVNWALAGTVLAGRTTDPEKTYVFTETTAASAIYRIVGEDFDGRKTYSPVIKVNCDNEDSPVQVWPNPVQHKLFLHVAARQPALVRIQLYDARGQLVVVEQKSVLPGQNSMTIETSRLPAGAYQLVMTWGTETKTIKVIKQ